jgi:AbiV family abortive infection protein
MEPRRIADLSQLADPRLFEEIAAGLVLIHENATRLWQSVDALATQGHFRGAEILKWVASEEAAKYLILLDAVRCPRVPAERFSAQLRKFNDHLARGLYAEAYDWRPVDFRELREGIERECKAYYLDGPNGVDWIFRNDIKREREEALYVDYVGRDGEHGWVTPKTHEQVSASFFFSEPVALRMIRHLHDAGFSNASALSVIAGLWRARTFEDATHIDECIQIVAETLQALYRQSLLSGDREAHDFIADRWLFPLHGLPMKIIEVSKDELRAIRDRWHPDA